MKVAIASRNTELDALAALCDGGKLRIYDGTQPATPETAVGAQNLLAELTLANPAFGAADAGVITANAIAQDADADATGAATWFRVVKSDGATAVLDGTAGDTGAEDLVLNSAAIQEGAAVSISSLTITLPQGP